MRVGRGVAHPLSFAQRQFWFFERLVPGSTIYKIEAAYRLRGPLDSRVLRRALDALVRRHEALRTTFVESGGDPVQVIHPPAALDVPLVDLAGLPDPLAEAGRLAEQESRRPFDLRTGPLVRVVLFRAGVEDHILMASMHHIVSDGWSFAVFFHELSQLYEAFRDGRPSPLPELPVQFLDYSAWQWERYRDSGFGGGLQVWRDRLAEAPLLELPTDRPRPSARSFRGDIVPVPVSPEVLEPLSGLCRAARATPYMALVGAYAAALSRWSGAPEVVVGSPAANRTRVETESVIGPFVNTLALRIDCSGDPAFHELLGRVRPVVLEAFEHQEVPFERVVAEANPARDLRYDPLFQAMLALQTVSAGTLRLPGLRVEPWSAATQTSGSTAPLRLATGTSKVDLTLFLRPGPDLGGVLEYATDLFERPTVERMAGDFVRLLEAAVAEPGRRLSEL